MFAFATLVIHMLVAPLNHNLSDPSLVDVRRKPTYLLQHIAQKLYEVNEHGTFLAKNALLPTWKLDDDSSDIYARVTRMGLVAFFDHFYAHWTEYKDHLLLRSQQVANSPELVRRLGVIAMNSPFEVDTYAHANSTHALGSRMRSNSTPTFMEHGTMKVKGWD
ncbi:hypothetical protein EV421DRAFT_1935682 [Armillaria borealis]|uniref:Acetyl-CoA hydrolase/transferase C-terminal domain-containing protein n=1 Tax=Armillaria borealis TaxID=47425 RepID=A0AA39IV43_9AGAR|nr:hypothetical protein EV421DRAFT_1935682 [Armillaria borealis]